jgi:hypothetical protein
MLLATWVAAGAACAAAAGAIIYAGIANNQLGQMIETTKASIRAADAAEDTFRATYDPKGIADRTVQQMASQSAAQFQAAQSSQAAVNTAKETLEVESRPWLKIKIETIIPSKDDPLSNGDLTFDRDGNANFTFRATVTNVGKSVAKNVWIFPKLFADRIGEPHEVIKRGEAFCKNLPPSYFQRTDIFAGDEFTQNEGVSVGKAEVLSQSMAYPEEPTRKFVKLYLVGCVDYQFSFGAKHHQTGFNYTVNSIFDPRDPSHKMANGMPIIGEFEVGKNATAKEIWIVKSFWGGNYAY